MKENPEKDDKTESSNNLVNLEPHQQLVKNGKGAHKRTVFHDK